MTPLERFKKIMGYIIHAVFSANVIVTCLEVLILSYILFFILCRIDLNFLEHCLVLICLNESIM